MNNVDKVKRYLDKQYNIIQEAVEKIDESKDIFVLRGEITKGKKSNSFEVRLNPDKMGSSAAGDLGYEIKMLKKANKHLSPQEIAAIAKHLDSDQGQENDGESRQDGYDISHVFDSESEY
jgi:uncharacterized protein YfkK (UPF0435 family)